MNYRLVKCFVAASTLLAVIACDEVLKQEKFLPESTGSVNQVIVATTHTIWKGAVGDSIRKYFAAPIEASTIPEPEFTLTFLPQPIWKGAITKSRNVLYVLKDTLEASYIKKNLYARPQNIAVVKSKDLENLKNNLIAVTETAKYNFRETELELAQERLLKSLSSKALFEERLGLSLRMPSVYRLGVDKDNFLWYDRPVEGGTLNLMAYSLEKGYFSDSETFLNISSFFTQGQPLYMLLYASGIIFFTFFYTSITFNPTETADNLRKYGGFIPGIRPGESTAIYIENILTKLTTIGALYLTLVCLMPEFLISKYPIPFYLGGTSILIVVVVAIDTVTQIQTRLMSSQYEQLIKKTKFGR